MIQTGNKYGCLTVLDNGEEYRTTEKYFDYLEKLSDKKKKLESFKMQREKLIADNPELYERWKECIHSKTMTRDIRVFHEEISDLNLHMNWILKDIKAIETKTEPHYKCQCKCGKIHYYNATTLEKEPRYCIYPITIANTCNYSNRARNATYSKRKKYEELENVLLWEKCNCSNESSPKWFSTVLNIEVEDPYLLPEEYCELYNNAIKNDIMSE